MSIRNFAERVEERATDLRSHEQILNSPDEAQTWWVRTSTAISQRPHGRVWDPHVRKFSNQAIVDRSRLPVLPTAVSFVDNMGKTPWLILDLDSKSTSTHCQQCEREGREPTVPTGPCAGCEALFDVRWEHDTAVRNDAAALSLILDEYELPWFADIADSNGVHIYAKLSGPTYYKHLGPIIDAFKLVAPRLDTSVGRTKKSTIRLTGSWTKSMKGFQRLIVPEEQALHAMGVFANPVGLDDLLSDLKFGRLRGFGELPKRAHGYGGSSDSLRYGVSARIRDLAATGEYGDRYDSPSEARFAIISSYVRAGSSFESFRDRMRTAELAGYVKLLERKSTIWSQMDKITERDWNSAQEKPFAGALERTTDTRTGAGGAQLSLSDKRTSAWFAAAVAIEPNLQALRSVVEALARIHLKAVEASGGTATGFTASCRYVALASEVSATTAWRAMKKLEDAGLLRCLTRGAKGREHPSTWSLVIPRNWQKTEDAPIPHREVVWMGEGLDLRSKRIWEMLGEGMNSVRGIAVATGMDPKTVRGRMYAMETKGLVRREEESGWVQVALAEADADGHLRENGRTRRDSRAALIMNEIDQFRRRRESYTESVLNEVNFILAQAEKQLREGEGLDLRMNKVPVFRCNDWSIQEMDDDAYDYMLDHDDEGYMELVGSGLVYGVSDVWKTARKRVDANGLHGALA